MASGESISTKQESNRQECTIKIAPEIRQKNAHGSHKSTKGTAILSEIMALNPYSRREDTTFQKYEMLVRVWKAAQGLKDYAPFL